MYESYNQAAREVLPEVRLAIDRFQVAQKYRDAADTVRQHAIEPRAGLLEFAGAIARKDDVRVRIDEAGHDHPPTRVEGLCGLMLRGEISRRAEIDDQAVGNCQRAILDH